MKLLVKIQMVAFGLLLVLACVASSSFTSVSAQADQTASGCFTTSATQAARYVVPDKHRAWPGNDQSYGPGARVWGGHIVVCPDGLTPSGTDSSASSAGWCYAVIPAYDTVTVGNPGPQPRVAEFNSTQRRWELSWHWKNGGAASWLKASGATWTGTLCQESRQPDERIHVLEGLGPTLVVEGLELRGSAHAQWPACISTDQPIVLDADGGFVQPDKKNPAKVCTNCAVVNQTFSFWSDCGDWSELWPENRNRD